VVIIDNCGSLAAGQNVRRSVSATVTAQKTGPVFLDVLNWKNGPISSLNVSFIDNIRVRPEQPDFTASPRELSCAAGGSSRLKLDPGAQSAGDDYLILSSLSGTWPGFSRDGITVPLNPDSWTRTALGLVNSSLMEDFKGTIGSSGTATAFLNTPGPLSPAMAGRALFFDYVLLEGAGAPLVTRASQPVYVLLIP
jgi:hypothetical protein